MAFDRELAILRKELKEKYAHRAPLFLSCTKAQLTVILTLLRDHSAYSDLSAKHSHCFFDIEHARVDAGRDATAALAAQKRDFESIISGLVRALSASEERVAAISKPVLEAFQDGVHAGQRNTAVICATLDAVEARVVEREASKAAWEAAVAAHTGQTS